MESSYPTLASTMKHERRWKSKSLPSNTATLVMAFFSCLASLYVAGRLWQDAQNRMLLTKLLEKNLDRRPKVLSVEDKLMILGCKAKASRSRRNLYRVWGPLEEKCVQDFLDSKWTPVVSLHHWEQNSDALRKLEERGVLVHFVIGRSPNRGDSLDRSINEENHSTKDFLILEAHEEASEELPKKAKFFFSTAFDTWDAEFYVKVDDNVKIDLDGLIEILESQRGKTNVYMGCMKSGDVISEAGKLWHEPEWWKFGDQKSYFRHAAGSLLVLSRSLAQYIHVNSGSLQAYAHDDISIGSWMIGVEATYVDENRFCCSSSTQDKACSIA